MKVAVIVDMQNDFVTGTLGTKEAQAIVPNVVAKINGYKDEGRLFIVTKDTHYDDYLQTNEGAHLPVAHCIHETPGHDLILEVEAVLSDVDYECIEKETFGSLDTLAHTIEYYLNELGEKQEDLEIELIGLCTDICVVSNALILKANFPEARITLDSSCCAGVTPESHQAALTTMKMCQIEVY